MKKHNLLKVVLITIAIALFLTWILPVTSFSYGTLVDDQGYTQVGIFDVSVYIRIVFQYFTDVAIYLLAVGGFYGILHKISGYRNLLDKIVKKFRHNEWFFLSLVMVLFAVMASMAGMAYALLFLFPFIISIVLLMGYDKITAAMVTVGSVMVGLIGTVFSDRNVSAIYYMLGETTTSDTNVVLKVLILVVGLCLLIFNVLSYAKKHRDTKEIAADKYVPEVSEKKSKSLPIIIFMDLVLVVMILTFVSWKEVFGIEVFENVLTTIREFELFGFPIFDKLLGNYAVEQSVYQFGYWQWSVAELSVLLLVISAIIAFIYGLKLNEYFDNFIKGMKRALKPAVYVLLAYLVLVILTTNPVTITIIRPIIEATSGLNIATMSLSAFISSVMNVDIQYVATSGLQFVQYYLTDQTTYPIISVIWQSMYGLAMLIAPTSAILLVTLSYLNVSYSSWLKNVLKLFVELLVALLIILTIAFVIA